MSSQTCCLQAWIQETDFRVKVKRIASLTSVCITHRHRDRKEFPDTLGLQRAEVIEGQRFVPKTLKLVTQGYLRTREMLARRCTGKLLVDAASLFAQWQTVHTHILLCVCRYKRNLESIWHVLHPLVIHFPVRRDTCQCASISVAAPELSFTVCSKQNALKSTSCERQPASICYQRPDEFEFFLYL